MNDSGLITLKKYGKKACREYVFKKNEGRTPLIIIQTPFLPEKAHLQYWRPDQIQLVLKGQEHSGNRIKIVISDSHRYGKKIMGRIRKMFPNEIKQVQNNPTHDLQIIPITFKQPIWIYGRSFVPTNKVYVIDNRPIQVFFDQKPICAKKRR